MNVHRVDRQSDAIDDLVDEPVAAGFPESKMCVIQSDESERKVTYWFKLTLLAALDLATSRKSSHVSASMVTSSRTM